MRTPLWLAPLVLGACATARPAAARSSAPVQYRVDLTHGATQYVHVEARIPSRSDVKLAVGLRTSHFFTAGGTASEPVEAGWRLEEGVLVETGERAQCQSAHGVFDMAGNVWEWTADMAPGGDVEVGAGAEPAGAPAMLVVGGGGVDIGVGIFAYRTDRGPSWSGDDTGFRCARPLR